MIKDVRYAKIQGRSRQGTDMARKDKVRLRRLRDFSKKAGRLVLILGLILLCIYEYHYLVNKSGIFTVKDLIIGGNSVLTKEEIASYSGIRLGSRIGELNTVQTEKRLGMVPRIKSVVVERINFNQVRILVKERTSYAVAQLDNTFFVVDDEGVIIQEGEIESLPFITGLRDVEEGGLRRIDRRQFDVAKKWIEMFAALKIHDIMSEINIEDPADSYIYTTQGIKVFVGDIPERTIKVMPYLLKFLREIEQQGKDVEYIDIRYNDEMAVKYRNG